MRKYNRVFFEIAGVCNAKCPYCITGNKSARPGEIIDVDMFFDILGKLLKEKVIDNDATIYLFNKGEPFLHPRFSEIIDILHDYGFQYEISTNGSILPVIDKKLASGLLLLTFSMPGFSQESYDKIHGFDFEEIKRNIAAMSRELGKHGYNNLTQINYHLYQFSLFEIKECEKFAKQNGVKLRPTLAFLNDWWMMDDWLNDRTSLPVLKKMMEEMLFFSEYRKLMGNVPKGYACDQFDALVIDEEGNMATCCALPKDHPDYNCGNVLNDDIGMILRNKHSRPVCRPCHQQGITYALNEGCVNREDIFGVDNPTTKVTLNSSIRRAIIFGTGAGGATALKLAERLGWEVAYFIDNNKERWNSKVGGYMVKNPEILKHKDFDVIIVSSMRGKNRIFDQLNEMGFSYRKDYIYFLDSVYLNKRLISVKL